MFLDVDEDVVISNDFGEMLSILAIQLLISDYCRYIGTWPSLCSYHILDYFRRSEKFGEVSIYQNGL